MKSIKAYITKEISLLGFIKPRFVWFLFWLTSVVFLGVTFLFFEKLISTLNTNFLNFAIYSLAGIIFVLLIFILFKIFLENKLKGYILLTLIFSGIAFYVEKYSLNNEIFSPFTPRTTILLWFTFSFLFASIFYQNISKWILLFFPPILFIGFLLSFCFVLIMFPFMLIGWIAILFLGLGILPYTPIMASAAFLVMCYRCVSELRDNKYYLQYTFSKYLTYAMLLFISIYFIWFHSEWNKGQFIIRNHFLENKIINSKKSLIDDDLPAWASLGMKLPVNHVSELYLQPESINQGMQFTFLGSDKLFDPFAFIVSNISKKADLPNEDREHLLKLLFGYTHISLDRLWNGNSLITTDVETYLQFFPETRIVHSDLKISIYNESNLGQQEAIYTLKIPEGSVCSNLSLWIDDKEIPARLTSISKAKKAYDTIVGIEKRDPSYVTWMEDNLLRIKIFPINKNNYRTFKVGIISPLHYKNNILSYEGIKIEGPALSSTKHRIFSKIFNSPNINLLGKNYTFEKQHSKPTKDNSSNWFSYGNYENNWGISLLVSNMSKDDSQLKVLNPYASDLDFKTKEFNPQKIYILINSSLSKEKWKDIYSNLSKNTSTQQIILVTNEWFYSKNKEENLDFIDSNVLPKFNLFPFYKIANETDILVITNSETNSIPSDDLKGSLFFDKNKEFFSKNRKIMYVLSLNGTLSSYFNSLKEFELIQDLNYSLDEISQSIASGKIRIPAQSESIFSIPESNITFNSEKLDKIDLSKRDILLSKLILYKKIMRSIGKRKKQSTSDTYETEIYQMAEEAMIVTPITSLIVLESEMDYKRFGIHKNKNILNETEIKVEDKDASKIKHGKVPEPEEWVIFIICLIFIILWKKIKMNRA